jgi:Uma2 family endonuclease
MQTSELVTAEQLERMGRPAFQFELVRGRLVRMNPPNADHGRIAALLAARLLTFVEPLRLGTVMVETGYTLSRNPDSVRGPDVSFVRSGRVGFPARRGFVPGAPDLAVEVRSPDDTIPDLLAKAAEYVAAGAELVWIVDPDDATVRVVRRDSGPVTLGVRDMLDGGSTVPGFSLSLTDLFNPPR